MPYVSKEKKREYNRRHHLEHREEYLGYKRRYRAEHKERCTELSKLYWIKHKERINKNRRLKWREQREMLFIHYGQKCSWPGCDIVDPDMLQIDHINGGGNKHRKQSGFSFGLCAYVIKHNFPPEFRILCANHNWKYRMEMERARCHCPSLNLIRQRRNE